MKTLVLMMALMLVALPVWGATFPTVDDHTLVSADSNGLITVKVAGETDGWFLVQYCQDNLRAGCGNKIVVQPSSVNAASMTFQLDMGGVKDGQVAFNFRRNCDKKWLAIPDCRVKTGNNMGMGMSFFTADIEESGGAHFVYTRSGIQPWSPIDASKWCDEGIARTGIRPTASVASIPAAKVGGGGGNEQGAMAVATNQSAAAAHNSAAATNQSAAANNSSTANTTSLVNINQVGGKKGKHGNKAIVYAPNATQNVQNNTIRGNSADVKVYANRGGKGGVKNVITYVGPTYQTIHIGVPGAPQYYDPQACAKCHSQSAKDDERMRRMVLTQMSSTMSKEKNVPQKTPNRIRSQAPKHPVITHIK